MTPEEEIKELKDRIEKLEQQPKYYPPVVIYPQPYDQMHHHCTGCGLCRPNTVFPYTVTYS